MINIFDAFHKLATIIVLTMVYTFCLNTVAAAEDNRSKLLEEAQGQWEHYLDLLKDTGNFLENPMVPYAPERVPGYLFMTLAQAYSLIVASDPDFPEFTPYVNHTFNIAGPNPDTVYYFTSIDTSNTYRIYGNRGTVYALDFQLGYDYFGFAEKVGGVLQKKTFDEIDVAADGSFEILLGTKIPAGYKGNWIELDERVNFFVTRQIAYHPDEIAANMVIEKVAGEPTPKRYPDAHSELQAIVDYVKYSSAAWLDLPGVLVKQGVINRFVIPDWADEGGVTGQVYQHGLYDVAADEAMIVTVRLPEQCDYWNVQTTDMLWQTHDFMRTQSSFNGHIDRSDGDGLTRIVFSHRDPGAKNWIDLNDFDRGYVLMRWINCQPDREPQVELIKFAELNEYLPADTTTVTPEQRLLEIRKAASARHKRRYW
ncbi:MAG: DUF1214 domain-containing protein [Halieaceae bacterium]|nr:DUF1214 domain-containing protein [Halieaceae bacterium]